MPTSQRECRRKRAVGTRSSKFSTAATRQIGMRDICSAKRRDWVQSLLKCGAYTGGVQTTAQGAICGPPSIFSAARVLTQKKFDVGRKLKVGRVEQNIEHAAPFLNDFFFPSYFSTLQRIKD